MVYILCELCNKVFTAADSRDHMRLTRHNSWTMLCNEEKDAEPPGKTILGHVTRFVSTSIVVIGYRLRCWADGISCSGLCHLRTVGYLGRIPTSIDLE